VTDLVQVVAVAVSSLLLVIVLDLVRRRRLTEEYAFIWIVCAGALLLLSLWRESLHAVARWLDVHYPPAILLLVLVLFVFVASLHFSLVISRQRAQIERLAEEVAILTAQHRELAEAGRPRASGDVAPGSTPPSS